MNPESPQRKPPSPRACTEVSSLQKNKTRNREGLGTFLSILKFYSTRTGFVMQATCKGTYQSRNFA